MNEYIHVGLDVHLDSITAAIVEGDSENVSVQNVDAVKHKDKQSV